MKSSAASLLVVLLAALPLPSFGQGVPAPPSVRGRLRPRALAQADSVLREAEERVLLQTDVINAPDRTAAVVAEAARAHSLPACPSVLGWLRQDRGWIDVTYDWLVSWIAAKSPAMFELCIPVAGDSVGERLFKRTLDVNARMLARGRDTTALRIETTWLDSGAAAVDSASQAAWLVDAGLPDAVISRSVQCLPKVVQSVAHHRRARMLPLASRVGLLPRQVPCPILTR